MMIHGDRKKEAVAANTVHYRSCRWGRWGVLVDRSNWIEGGAHMKKDKRKIMWDGILIGWKWEEKGHCTILFYFFAILYRVL